MVVSFMAVASFTMCCMGAGLFWRTPWPPSLLLYLYVTMRCYEEGVADMRSAYTMYKLLFLTPKTMATMVELRKAALVHLEGAISQLPATVGEVTKLTFDEALPTRSLNFYFPWWLAQIIRLFGRRTKKDWNEVLRLSDYGTMDYFQ